MSQVSLPSPLAIAHSRSRRRFHFFPFSGLRSPDHGAAARLDLNLNIPGDSKQISCQILRGLKTS